MAVAFSVVVAVAVDVAVGFLVSLLLFAQGFRASYDSHVQLLTLW